ncbi:MAG TPA: lysophospholipid acyltransferase family protein [Gemmatimonadaceae bacterium]|nr:lysophospholipid acyltransferase family protein [Gemmatimonadaceae bacterium]
MSAPAELSPLHAAVREPVTPFADRATIMARVALSFLVMAFGALVMLLVAVPTVFMARRLYAEVIGKRIGAAVLKLWGVSYSVHRDGPPPQRQVVYISNHPSTIDLFLLIALGLPRTRFFLGGFLRKIIPIGIIGYLVRIFWTVPQEFPEKRRQIFQRADRILRQSGDSVYLSPEGMRVTTGEIGRFNKGSFHLATSLGAPIVPLYFEIPADTNPGMGYDARPGNIDVWFLPPIETAHWRVEDVEHNRDRVHELYLRIHDAVRAGVSPAGMTIESERQ